MTAFAYLSRETCASVPNAAPKLKYGPIWTLFVYFCPFHITIQFQMKKRRCCAWDLNPGRLDGRRRRMFVRKVTAKKFC